VRFIFAEIERRPEGLAPDALGVHQQGVAEFEREALLMMHEHGPLTPSEYAHQTGSKQTLVKVQLSRTCTKKLITHRDGKICVTVQKVLPCYRKRR
jgi:hypothetical protein